MSARALIFVVVALLMAGTTAYVARSWLSSERAASAHAKQTPQQVTKNVLVAAADLPAGTFLKTEHVRWQAWPDNAVSDAYLVEGTAKPADVIGAVVRRGIVTGEPITNGRIVRPGDRGFLAAVLQPGMRAVSVAVNATSGIAGLVFPGDRVDILLTQTVPGSTDRRASETVLENVRVLAIDQVLNDQAAEPTLGKNATIEVTPKQAEMIAVISDMGKISLSLRSLGRPTAGEGANEPTETADSSPEPWRGETFTWDSDASRVLSGRRSAKGPAATGYKVTVVQGGKAEQVTFGGVP